MKGVRDGNSPFFVSFLVMGSKIEYAVHLFV